MCKISIIIPVYNTEKYLERCLNSVVNQTLKDIEIICVDDCSTDSSKLIIEKYASQYNNILPIYLKENGGVANARNKAIKSSNGEFIGFVDSDDYVDLQYYEELYKYSKDYDVVRGIRVINLTNSHAKNPYGCIIPSIIRRQLLIENNLFFPTKMKVGEDSTFKRWLYLKTNKIFECPDNGIYYHYIKRS